jgi:hypothetical protein
MRFEPEEDRPIPQDRPIVKDRHDEPIVDDDDEGESLPHDGRTLGSHPAVVSRDTLGVFNGGFHIVEGATGEPPGPKESDDDRPLTRQARYARPTDRFKASGRGTWIDLHPDVRLHERTRPGSLAWPAVPPQTQQEAARSRRAARPGYRGTYWDPVKR